jgi:hypothetical protein
MAAFTWFDTLLAARYRGAASDALLDAAVKRGLITADDADIIKTVPNGGFKLEPTAAPADVTEASTEA